MENSTLLSLGCGLSFWQSVWQIAGEAAVRNIGLICAALFGIGLAFYRSMKLNQQTKTAIRQAETSEAGLNIDRFQKGVAMLGDNSRSVKQGGLLILYELAYSSPEKFRDNVVGIFRTHIYSYDVKDLIASYEDHDKALYNRLTPDYSAAIFSLILLNKLNIEETNATKSGFMQDLFIAFVNLQNLNVSSMDFSNSIFRDVDFKDTIMTETNLSNAVFENCKNLTYAQLYQAKNVDPEFLAKLKADEDQAAAEAAKSAEENTPT